MTERSWIWEGTATGDATLAPYAKAAFNDWFLDPKSNHQTTQLYVLPGYAEDLTIEPQVSSAYSTLAVHPGIAIFGNYIYELTETKYIDIPANRIDGRYRYDFIVLRLNRLTQKINLALVSGTELTTAAEPTLEQSDTGIYEIPLCRIYVDEDLTFLVTDRKLVYYNQDYLPVGPHYTADPVNLITNSEFIAMQYTQALGTVEVPPGWYWLIESGGGVAPTISRQAALGEMTRGSSARFVPWAGNTGDEDLGAILLYGEQKPPPAKLTIEGLLKANNDTTRAKVVIRFGDYELTSDYWDSEIELAYLENTDLVRIKRTVDVPADTQFATLFIIFVDGTSASVDVGQFIVSPGYFTGGFRPFHETIMFDWFLEDAAWDAGSAKSSGTTTVDLSASYQALISPDARAVVLSVAGRDSASATATDYYIAILAYTSNVEFGRTYVNGTQSNDRYVTSQVIAYIDEPFRTALSTSYGFRVTIAASGGNTLDVWVPIIGVIT